MNTHRILLVDDEADKLELIRNFLRREFFEVATAQDGVEALAILDTFNPDLVILDVHMPRKDGLETCRELRNRDGYEFNGQKRILMFSDKRIDEADRITGLYLGADQYLVRPVAPGELLAVIRALLRSIPVHADAHPRIPGAKRLVVDPGALELLCDERVVMVCSRKKTLSELSFKLLLYLAERLDQAVSKDEIITAVWGYNYSDEVLTTQIYRLRQEIEQDPRKPRYLQTVRDYGYKLVSGVDDI